LEEATDLLQDRLHEDDDDDGDEMHKDFQQKKLAKTELAVKQLNRELTQHVTSSDSRSICFVLLDSDSSHLLTGGDMRSSSRQQVSSDPVKILTTKPKTIVSKKPSKEYHK